MAIFFPSSKERKNRSNYDGRTYRDPLYRLRAFLYHFPVPAPFSLPPSLPSPHRSSSSSSSHQNVSPTLPTPAETPPASPSPPAHSNPASDDTKPYSHLPNPPPSQPLSATIEIPSDNFPSRILPSTLIIANSLLSRFSLARNAQCILVVD